MEQASSSSSTSLLSELCVPLVKGDMLGSMLLLEPLVSDLHLLSSTISSRGLGFQTETRREREKEREVKNNKRVCCQPESLLNSLVIITYHLITFSDFKRKPNESRTLKITPRVETSAKLTYTDKKRYSCFSSPLN